MLIAISVNSFSDDGLLWMSSRHRNPLSRARLAAFPRCSLDPYDSEMGALPPVGLGPP